MTKINKYTIQKELGKGGFGIVYLVEYGGKQFALKQLLDKVVEPEISERFIHESLRIEELRKKYKIDSLAQVFDVLFDNNAFVMEFLPEGSKEYYARTKDDNFLSSIILAVYKLHKIGVAHRDIKPENLRVKNSHPILIDFGIASWWDSTSNVIPTGTRVYSPPEMISIFNEYKNLKAARNANKELIEIKPQDARERLKYIKKLHDIYSLGITIGELLTGKLPFNRTSYYEYLENGDEPEYQKWLEMIPLKFREFVKEATAFFPVKRLAPDDLINYIKPDTTIYEPDIINNEIIIEENEIESFDEENIKCLNCSNTTIPPANFCPNCGAELSLLVLNIEPFQEIETFNLPDCIGISNEFVKINLDGKDFEIVLGRNLSGTHISFPDDNWMSGLHGVLSKEIKTLYYLDGKNGISPTNPGIINNIPIGNSKIELLSGAFLTLGSTVFKVKKYFQKKQI